MDETEWRKRSDGGLPRFGEADLTNCDREPIHIPGSIQPHGAMLVFDRDRKIVTHASANAAAMLGAGEIVGSPLDAILARDPRPASGA